MTYQSFKALKPHTFLFSPYILKEFRNRWFIFGKGQRDRFVVNFALDRILSVEPAAGETFIDDPLFDPEKYFSDVVGVTKIPGTSDKAMDIRFLARAPEAPYIETKPIHPSQMVLERMDDGTVIFQIHACHNYELEKAFLEFGEGVKVLAPKLLVSRIKKRLRLAADQYEVRTECMNSSR